jgi:membrane protein DedA with SNARE-associated domain
MIFQENRMLDKIETAILSTLQMIFDEFGWAGVFGLMAFENATGITPSEIILAFAGWMLIERHGISPSFILLAGVYAGLGSAVGASITYWVARMGGRPVIDRFARLFRVDPSHISGVEGQIHKWGLGLVLVGRVIPGVRTLISIPAGLVGIPFPKFFLATFAGAYVWCTLLIGAGYVLGHEWMLISQYIKEHTLLLLVGGFGFIALYIIYFHRSTLLGFAWERSQDKE